MKIDSNSVIDISTYPCGTFLPSLTRDDNTNRPFHNCCCYNYLFIFHVQNDGVFLPIYYFYPDKLHPIIFVRSSASPRQPSSQCKVEPIGSFCREERLRHP